MLLFTVYRNHDNVTATTTITKFVICDYAASSFPNFRKYISTNHAWYSSLFQVPDTTFVLMKGNREIKHPINDRSYTNYIITYPPINTPYTLTLLSYPPTPSNS